MNLWIVLYDYDDDHNHDNTDDTTTATTTTTNNSNDDGHNDNNSNSNDNKKAIFNSDNIRNNTINNDNLLRSLPILAPGWEAKEPRDKSTVKVHGLWGRGVRERNENEGVWRRKVEGRVL